MLLDLEAYALLALVEPRAKFMNCHTIERLTKCLMLFGRCWERTVIRDGQRGIAGEGNAYAYRDGGIYAGQLDY